jgi:hypothetical protein
VGQQIRIESRRRQVEGAESEEGELMVRYTVKRHALPYLMGGADQLGFFDTAERIDAMIAGDPEAMVTIEIESALADAVKNDVYLSIRGYVER